ncbi:hydroxyethylthiazole kinase [Actinobacillus seminis]|uniref:Hydroxyethylthiazole kinase n=1 Tax=Actinobacillus seminis TaxID=722 RepID=A0A263HFE4_9PAST|nr:hydroxyethylthiazole kinase [Actinobacillus seminis]OZN25851.1 hydroxyethylthiazole kinase [Actinobacillus seminis]SUU34629.1 hydroxyethylthiazole kinase [Actinobacillus seminis]
MQFNLLAKIKNSNPLVHCMTNTVVSNYTANGLLALGASPLMSVNIHEMANIQQFSQGLLINIGTLKPDELEAMLIAGKYANRNGVAVVLDPVGVGATEYRRDAVKRLLSDVKFTLIRGNIGEIATLANVAWQAKGVDAGEGQADVAKLTQTVALKYACIVATSGTTDVISDGRALCKISNGTSLFPRITGSGCLLGAVCAAFLGVAEKTQQFAAAVEACTLYALAGELAAKPLALTQTGTFSTALLDQLGAISSETVQQYARVTYD